MASRIATIVAANNLAGPQRGIHVGAGRTQMRSARLRDRSAGYVHFTSYTCNSAVSSSRTAWVARRGPGIRDKS